MAAITICSDSGAQKSKVSHCSHCFPAPHLPSCSLGISAGLPLLVLWRDLCSEEPEEKHRKDQPDSVMGEQTMDDAEF